ncbi:MAG: SDR family oxidoreductase [Caldisphaeraceae archaeon]|nr:SDR family oxidoreductase [Caldisphaeraceae archaeon]
MRVLVTASTSGIGLGVAKVLLQNGHKVVINGHNEKNMEKALETLKPMGSVHGVLADITVLEEAERLVKDSIGFLGGLDSLVYIAPPPKPGSFEELPLEEWEGATRSLLLSPVWLTKLTLKYIKEARGSYIYLSSYVIKEPDKGLALSNVVRISLAGLTKTLSKELGKYGIRVNMVMPGWIETARVDEILQKMARAGSKGKEELLDEIRNRIPLKRIAKPEEVGQLVEYLISKNTYINGASIPIDGGILNSVF